MPYVSRLFIKTGIAYLVVTFVAGAVMLSLEALGHPVPFIIGIEHGHAGFIGWLVNMVIGVAYWLLPANRTAMPGGNMQVRTKRSAPPHSAKPERRLPCLAWSS